ncbi:MAG: nucleotidyltransferase family protein [Alphaproteobacteria bacterium]|nr:nucleotidyltransferase family protein [Alphaproteobacteria bacterium]MBO4644166.1 nucleotidyltransferase family protein [Alphaproteobacteria bacterium]
MPAQIEKAMVLAAGRGTRMRSLTDEVPKPLIKVKGRTLIDRIIDKIVAYGITQGVVNVCYLGDMIKADLSARTDISLTFSEEDEALETGGGVKKALPLLGDKPFFVLNSDPLWTEERPSLTDMARAFDENKTDILLLLWPKERVFGHDGTGDYYLENGRPRRRHPEEGSAPYVYAGAQIINPDIFKDAPDGKFSLNLLYDKAEKAGRLAAVVGDGDWYHVGTPEALALAEKRVKE